MKRLTPHALESNPISIESDRPLSSRSTRQRVAKGCARGDDDDDDGDDDGESGGGVR